MIEENTPVWGIHMGRPGGKPDDRSIALTRRLQREGYVALGWPCMGDLGALPSNRGAFKTQFLEACFEPPTTRSLAQQAGMLFRFAHVLGVGDLIVSHTPGGGPVNIGAVIGNYEYGGGDGHDYHHRRKVVWMTTVQRDELSEVARNAMTVQMSLFRIYDAADDFRQLAMEAPVQYGTQTLE